MAGTNAFWDSIVPISSVGQYSIGRFACGVPELDKWFRESSITSERRGECRVHVCIDRNGSVVAFFTLSALSINPSGLSSGHRGGISGAIPATLLGKLGVCEEMQGSRGCGTAVLNEAKRRSFESSMHVSSRLLVVDAMSDELVGWYEKRGFKSLEDDPRRLVCKMSSIGKELGIIA